MSHPCPMDDTCGGDPLLLMPHRFALTSPKTASGPQRIVLVFWVKPWEGEGRREVPAGQPGPAHLPRGRQTPSLPPSLPAWPGPTSEAELHLPLAMARQAGDPPDADAERHGASGGQRCRVRPCSACRDSALTRPAGSAARCPHRRPTGLATSAE